MHVTSTRWLRRTTVVCAAGLLALTMAACQGQAGRLSSDGLSASSDTKLSGSSSDALGGVLFDGRATSIADAGRPAWTNRNAGQNQSAPLVSTQSRLVSPPPPPVLGTYTVRSASAPLTAQPTSLVTTWSGPRTYDVPPPPPPPAAPTAPYEPGFDNWSAPAAPSGAVAPAPRLIGSTAPSAPTVVDQPVGPPTPPSSVTYVDQPVAPAAPVLTSPLQSRQWNGCGLPCANGISMWHVRGVIGRSFFSGTDSPEDCGYWGVDIGRTFCGCWGLDAFYRWNSGQFDRLFNGQPGLDGAEFPDGIHHIGLKLTYESSFGNSKWFWWGGVGPEYFWSEGYENNDSGFAIYGELGVGYVVNRSFRIRAGINVHGMDTDITRRDPANDGQSRWLWILAPVVQLEIDF